MKKCKFLYILIQIIYDFNELAFILINISNNLIFNTFFDITKTRFEII